MKTILLLGLLISGTAFAGGVSGGGGNLNPNPVDKMRLYGEVSRARRYAAFYLNYLERVRDQHQWGAYPELPGKLYDGSQSVVQKILDVPITYNKTGSCLDPAGNEMDGSARMDPPAICLSASRLHEKLSQESARNQVTALVVHEYSHLVGATEEEADFLQAQAVNDFLYADFDGMYQRLYDTEDLIFRLAILSSPKLWDEGPIDAKKWGEFSEATGEISSEFFMKMSFRPEEYLFSLWPSRLADLFPNTSVRLALARQGMCVLARGKDWKKCREDLNRIFQGQKEIDYHTYMVRTGHKPGEFAERPGVVFRRIENVADAKLDLGRLFPEVWAYYRYVYVMLYDREPDHDATVWRAMRSLNR